MGTAGTPWGALPYPCSCVSSRRTPAKITKCVHDLRCTPAPRTALPVGEIGHYAPRPESSRPWWSRPLPPRVASLVLSGIRRRLPVSRGPSREGVQASGDADVGRPIALRAVGNWPRAEQFGDTAHRRRRIPAGRSTGGTSTGLPSSTSGCSSTDVAVCLSPAEADAFLSSVATINESCGAPLAQPASGH